MLSHKRDTLDHPLVIRQGSKGVAMFGTQIFSAVIAATAQDPSWSGWLGLWGTPQPAGAFGFHLFDVINCFLLIATLSTIIYSNRIAKAALNKSYTAYVRSLTDNRYDAMDRIYLELLKSKREHPIKDYDTDPYPLMMWNFVETIIDKCEQDDTGELMKTWGPLVSAEARNHGQWMLKRDTDGLFTNSPYFKNEFLLLAHSLIPHSEDVLGRGDDVNFPVFMRLFRALEAQQSRLGLNDPAAFQDMFRRAHADPSLFADANEKRWELDDKLKNDDIRNNELARRRHHAVNHDWLQGRVQKFISRSQIQASKAT